MANEADKKVKVTLVRSMICSLQRQRDTLRALGLKRIGQSVTKDDTPSIRGMLSAVGHLVTIEEAD
ncbi:MAG TPA: 50S ribosomal protein L30 [Armatimonadetes bacterium]|jgi:large subunit ribosomal protein L30|nr:50S ribosomal protein L30 [Armatimonadota bacterium]